MLVFVPFLAVGVGWVGCGGFVGEELGGFAAEGEAESWQGISPAIEGRGMAR